MRKMPVACRLRTLNFLNYFCIFYFISFYMLFFLIDCIPSFFFYVLMLILAFGWFALAYPMLFLTMLFLPIIVEAILVKKSIIQPLKPNVGKIAQKVFIGISVSIIVYFYVIGYQSLKEYLQ